MATAVVSQLSSDKIVELSHKLRDTQHIVDVDIRKENVRREIETSEKPSSILPTADTALALVNSLPIEEQHRFRALYLDEQSKLSGSSLIPDHVGQKLDAETVVDVNNHRSVSDGSVISPTDAVVQNASSNPVHLLTTLDAEKFVGAIENGYFDSITMRAIREAVVNRLSSRRLPVEHDADTSELERTQAIVFSKSKPSIRGLQSYLDRLHRSTEPTSYEDKKLICKSIRFWVRQLEVKLLFGDEAVSVTAKPNSSRGLFRLKKLGKAQEEVSAFGTFPVLVLVARK